MLLENMQIGISQRDHAGHTAFYWLLRSPADVTEQMQLLILKQATVTSISWNRGFDTFYELRKIKHAKNPFSPAQNKCSGELLQKIRFVCEHADLSVVTRQDL